MPRVRPLAKAAMTTLGGGASATVATYRLALPMKLKTMLPRHSASSAVVICGGAENLAQCLHHASLHASSKVPVLIAFIRVMATEWHSSQVTCTVAVRRLMLSAHVVSKDNTMTG